MKVRILSILVRKELRDALRNRWFLLYAASFAALALAFSSAALLGSGQTGLANFGRTSASLINLVLLVVPLMGLTAGAQALVGERERGTLAYLLAQPISRSEVFLGKFLGQALALAGALLAGFGLSALLLVSRGGVGQVGVLAALVALALLLGTATLSIGMLVSALSRASSAALGASIFLWLLLAFGVDMALMGAAAASGLGIGTIFSVTLANPLSVFRLAAVLSMRSSLEILGPAGLYAARTYGALMLPVFIAVLAAWCVGPLAGAMYVFGRRDAA